MNARLTFIHALSPLHAGIGQGAGVIDLPIAREKATGLPFLPGSSLKGALRTRCQLTSSTRDHCTVIFGRETPNDDNNQASMVQFTDQRLLLLPIRSLAGVFAWCTSPYLLQRLARDLKDAQITPPETLPQPPRAEVCLIAKGEHTLVLDVRGEQKVYLEELDLTAQSSSEVGRWAEWIGEQVFHNDQDWQKVLKQRFCLVHDDVLNFMSETALEIIARIKLQDEAKTVQEGGLWYEETLPTETILSGLALATPTRNKETKALRMMPEEIFQVLEQLTGQTLQLGGKATVGRGLCHVQLANGQVQ